MSGFAKEAPRQLSLFDSGPAEGAEEFDDAVFKLQQQCDIGIAKTGSELNAEKRLVRMISCNNRIKMHLRFFKI